MRTNKFSTRSTSKERKVRNFLQNLGRFDLNAYEMWQEQKKTSANQKKAKEKKEKFKSRLMDYERSHKSKPSQKEKNKIFKSVYKKEAKPQEPIFD